MFISRSRFIVINSVHYKLIFRILLLLIIEFPWLIHSQVSAQQNTVIDSLTLLLETAKDDTNKVNILNELGWQYHNFLDYEKAYMHASEALSLAEKLDYKKGMALAYKIRGNYYLALGEYTEALNQFKLSIKISEEIGDKLNHAKCYANIAIIFSVQGNYSKALEYYLESAKKFEDVGDKQGMAMIYSDISKFYLQQGNYDEAFRYNSKAKEISIEIGTKEGICRSYRYTALILEYQGNYSEALDNLQMALDYANASGDKFLIADCNNKFGSVYLKQGNYYEALRYFGIALNMILETGHKYNLAVAYGNIGIIYSSLGDLPVSMKYHTDALKICEEIGDKVGIASELISIGNIYLKMDNYSAAIEHYTQALEIGQEIGAKETVGLAYDGLAMSYIKQADFSRALDYLQKELDIFEELGDKYISTAHAYLHFGAVYQEMGNYPAALGYYNLALEKSKDFGDSSKIARSYQDIASLHFSQAKSAGNSGTQAEYQESIEYFNKSLEFSLKMNDKVRIKDIYYGLSRADSALGRFDLAYEHHKLYTLYKDSLLNEDSRNKLIVLQIQYETEQKDKELALLNKENDIQALQISRQKIQRDGIIIIMAFLVVVGFLVFRSLHLRKKLEKQNAILQERRRISADLHDDIGTGLSEISLLSELVRSRTDDPGTKKEVEKIAGKSRELLDKIREIIWALNSNNDYLENLVSYIRWYASEYFENSKVLLKMDEPFDVPQTPISGEYRRNVFFSVKEALHNIVKHAEASEAEIIFKLEDGALNIYIHDNGKGIPEGKQNRFGNGIKNIMNRMEAIRGNVRIENNGGTKVMLTMPV